MPSAWPFGPLATFGTCCTWNRSSDRLCAQHAEWTFLEFLDNCIVTNINTVDYQIVAWAVIMQNLFRPRAFKWYWAVICSRLLFIIALACTGPLFVYSSCRPCFFISAKLKSYSMINTHKQAE